MLTVDFGRFSYLARVKASKEAFISDQTERDTDAGFDDVNGGCLHDVTSGSAAWRNVRVVCTT